MDYYKITHMTCKYTPNDIGRYLFILINAIVSEIVCIKIINVKLVEINQ